MTLFQAIGLLQSLSPNAQMFFIACLFLVVVYVITLVAFYPDAARRIREFSKVWQSQQQDRGTDDAQERGK